MVEQITVCKVELDPDKQLKVESGFFPKELTIQITR